MSTVTNETSYNCQRWGSCRNSGASFLRDHMRISRSHPVHLEIAPTARVIAPVIFVPLCIGKENGIEKFWIRDIFDQCFLSDWLWKIVIFRTIYFYLYTIAWIDLYSSLISRLKFAWKKLLFKRILCPSETSLLFRSQITYNIAETLILSILPINTYTLVSSFTCWIAWLQ